MELQHPHLSIIGDIGVDLVMGSIAEWPKIGTESILPRSELRAGGSAGNAALALRHLGRPVQLISAVGNDHFGRWLHGQFHGLQADFQVCDVGTTVSVGIMHTCGERNFFTTQGHLERLTYEHVLAHLKPASRPGSIVLLSGVFLLPELRRHYPELIATIAARGYQVALDTGWPSQTWDAATRAEVTGWLAQCDHVLVNELEATSIADTPDLSLAIEQLSALLKPTATLVVKTGARGAVGFQNGQRIDCESASADIFDTIGAGDSFNAGYLVARLGQADLAQALAAGCRTAVAILTRFPRQAILPGELSGCIAPADLKASTV